MSRTTVHCFHHYFAVALDQVKLKKLSEVQSAAATRKRHKKGCRHGTHLRRAVEHPKQYKQGMHCSHRVLASGFASAGPHSMSNYN